MPTSLKTAFFAPHETTKSTCLTSTDTSSNAHEVKSSSSEIDTLVAELFTFCQTRSGLASIVPDNLEFSISNNLNKSEIGVFAITKHYKQLECQMAVGDQGNGCHTLRYDLEPYSKNFLRLQTTIIGDRTYLTFKEISYDSKNGENKKYYFVANTHIVKSILSKMNKVVPDSHVQVMLTKNQRLKEYKTPLAFDGPSMWDIPWEQLTPAIKKYHVLDKMILETLAKHQLKLSISKKTIRIVNIAGGTARGIKDILELILSIYKGYTIDYVHVDSSEYACRVAKKRLDLIAKEDYFKDKLTYKIDCQLFDESYASSLENSADCILSEGGLVNAAVAPGHANAARFFNLFSKIMTANGLSILCGASPILLIDKDFSKHSMTVLDVSKKDPNKERYQFYVLRKQELESELKHTEEHVNLTEATLAQEALSKILAKIAEQEEKARLKQLEDEAKWKLEEEKQRAIRAKEVIEEEKRQAVFRVARDIEEQKAIQRIREKLTKRKAKINQEIKKSNSGKLLDEIAYRDITVEQGYAILQRQSPGHYLIIVNPKTYDRFIIVRYTTEKILKYDEYHFTGSWEKEGGSLEPRFGCGRTVRDLISVLKTNLNLDCIQYSSSSPRESTTPLVSLRSIRPTF